jgi:hypothetical protein
MGNKGNVVLYLDRELVQKSKALGFNLSKTFENHLEHLTTQFSKCNSANNSSSTSKNCGWWAGPDLNRRPLARKANVLTKLDDRPILTILIKSALLIFNFSFSATFLHQAFRVDPILTTVFSIMSTGSSNCASLVATSNLFPKCFLANFSTFRASLIKMGKPLRVR